ncbi:uncharacterized protein [Epargyreus clarus]|uniref:uncharacterized protein isoform X1 n=1 Tax=Epargyreus clarus TaxID=520877 RepID=UPI003C2E8A27
MNKLRKFGLKYCDLPTMLWNVAMLLRPMTLDIDKRYTKRIPVIFYILTTVIAICYVYVYVISMLWFVFVKCPETGDLIAATVVFSLGIASEIGTTKLIYIILNEKLVKNLVEQYLLCDSTVVPSSRFAQNIKKTLRAVKKRAIIFWSVIISNGVAYGGKPIILPGRHLMEDSLILYGLEPIFETPNYQIAYCLTLFGIICTCYTTSNITAFLIVITGYTEAQILALSEEMTQLWEDAEEHYRKGRKRRNIENDIENKFRVMNEFVKSKLTEIVKSHTMNINLLRQVENAFRGAIALEFMLLIISLIAELLGGLENTYIEIPFALMQVGMDCLIGQRVMDASVVFENAVYDSKWENFDTANMKIVLMILQNSQKTLKLSAGGVTTLNFTSLMAVLKSVYSAYTTLRSTMNVK